MPIRGQTEVDWDDDDGGDDDFGEAVDADDDFADDDEQTIPCPHCRREIHEDAERCPYCERYISDEDAPAATKPWWIIVGTLACLYIFYRWLVL